MSNNMEREKNERLTKEIEEEKMKDELTGVGMYEAGMTYEEMKSFLEAINQSKHPTSASNNKNIQKESQHSEKERLSEITPASGSEQVASQEANTEVSRSSHSYKLNHTSPTMHERKTRYSNSPESPSSFEMRNKRKSSDSDEIFETQLSENANSRHNTNRFSLSSRSGSALRECQNATEKRTAQDTQRELLERKLERWRLNPLNVNVNEKDVPLQQPNRPQAQERMPFRYCKEAHISEQRDQVMRAMSQHLKEMAELWYTWQPATYSVFQWGSPIQVGTANGSLDRKPLTDSKAEQVKAECTYRNSPDRACKRKASSLIAQYNKESSTEDEGDDDEFNVVRTKKKKIQPGNKMSNTERAANRHAHTSHEKATTSTNSHQRSSNDDNNDPKNTRRKRKTAEEKERSPELSVYPRRIVPPVPKARLSLARHRKENAVSKLSQQIQNTDKIVEQTKNQQKTKAMTTEEICETLDKDWPSSEEEPTVAKDVEIRPLPIPTNIQSKLQKRLMLNKTEATTETSVSLVTITEKRNQERGKEMGLKLYEQQKKKENFSRMENRNGNWEDELSNDEKKLSERIQASDVPNGNHSDNVSTSSNNINCPICNKWFPHDEIENHAANCEQFDTGDESNDKNQLECTICSKTHKMAEYEEHVNQCINKKKDEKHSRESEDAASTSSYCTFKPISEQEDSEIDYLGQFSSKSKTKISNGKKRKL